MEEGEEPTRIRTNLQSNQLNLVKHKSIDGSLKEYRHAQLLANSHSPAIKQHNIIQVKHVTGNDLNYEYSMEKLVNLNTLRSFLSSQSFTKMAIESRLDYVYRLMPTLIKTAKFLKQQYPEEEFVLSPEKIVLLPTGQVKISIVAMEVEDPNYQPLYWGISKENSLIWSLALICDEILRGKVSVNTQPYSAPDTKDRNLEQFLQKAIKNKEIFTFEQLQQLFEHPKDQLICSKHFKKVVKVDIESQTLFCQDCLKQQFYEWDFERADCRKAMDNMIDMYKTTTRQFQKLIRYARGQFQIRPEVQETINDALMQFKAEYSEYVNSIPWRKLPPVEQSKQILLMGQKLQIFREGLIDKYTKRIKKIISDDIRSEIIN